MAGAGTALAMGMTAIAAFIAVVPQAAADEFAVNTTKDGVDANTADTVCATAGGKCTLRAALDEADALPGHDNIDVPAGTYKLTRPVGPSSSNQGGAFYIVEGVTIDGAGAGRTIIRQTRHDRVIENVGGSFPTNPVELSDLKITGGRVTAPGNQQGGGIRNTGILVLADVTVARNAVVPNPGANSAGGGIYQDGGLSFLDHVSVTRNRVALKGAVSTASASGGGIRNFGGIMNIAGSTISHNRLSAPGGTSGGGIYADGVVEVEDSTIAGNRADEGAGINVTGLDASLRVDASTLRGNRATEGGALKIAVEEPTPITNSTLSGNSARRGSALYEVFGDVDVQQSTIAGNRARGAHGAIEIDDLISPPDVALSLEASAVANKGAECAGQTVAIEASAQNVLGDDTCSSGLLSTDLIASPKLRPLADNGGTTLTRRPKGSSPAIDFATSECPLSVDQRGVTRPQRAACDAGSIELEP